MCVRHREGETAGRSEPRGEHEGRVRTGSPGSLLGEQRRGCGRAEGAATSLGLPPRALPGNQAGRRQVVRGRQWRGGARNLGLNLALALRGAGPPVPVHLHAKEDEMNMQRGL